jgi:hypothetical protein
MKKDIYLPKEFAVKQVAWTSKKRSSKIENKIGHLVELSRSIRKTSSRFRAPAQHK